MKRVLSLAGTIGFLVLTLTLSALTAKAAQPQISQPGVIAAPVSTGTPQVQNTPTTVWQVQNPPTAMPQMQLAPVTSVPTGQEGMGMRRGRMGRRMGMNGGMQGRMQGRMGMTASGGASTTYGESMAGAPMTADGIARFLGMTAQDLYNQMASGKSLAQIAAEKGITQQQLNDAVMAGYIVASDQMLSLIFDHNLTGYELTGKHIQVACSQCHINNVYAGTPTTCIGCHAKDDVHHGKLGIDCAACHTTSTWKR